MKLKIITFLSIILIVSCKTVTIKNEKYKTSVDAPELGHLGHAKSTFNTNNTFYTSAIPVLENKVRLKIDILPLNEQLNSVYTNKKSNNQVLPNLHYSDSLVTKPEYVNITILDLVALTSEINAQYNRNIFTYLQDTKKTAIITGVAMLLPNEYLVKLRSADDYYLVNIQEKKYGIVLYKQGKKLDVIDLHNGIQLAYRLGHFCWSTDVKNNWYVGDIVNSEKSCLGKTKRKIKEKEQENLFKM